MKKNKRVNKKTLIRRYLGESLKCLLLVLIASLASMYILSLGCRY